MSAERDLFNLDRALLPSERSKLFRKGTQPNGYAAPPGTGPAGETCKTCKHIARIEYAKTYLKCRANAGRWTGGRATDILAGSPACRLWESPTPATDRREG